VYRSGITAGRDGSASAREVQPQVVIKLRDEEDTRARVASLAVAPGRGASGVPAAPSQLNDITRRFPGTTVTPLARAATGARLQAMVRQAQRAAGRAVPNLANFYAVSVPRGTDPQALIGFAQDVRGVERAYMQGAPTPPPVTPGDDPRASNQRYLLRAPRGVDARYAWTVPGGDGRGITFVDIEQGWTLNHEDLTGGGIALVSGVNHAYHGHGTAVLGEVMAQDNTRGCIGITPLVTGKVVSQFRTTANYSTFDAIISAILATRYGDVILLEAQTTLGGSNFLPVEVDFDVFAAIWVATLLGRVVVEAAGNGNTDLDTFRHPTDGFILKRGHADFRDSGAIIVGAATSVVPHRRLVLSGALASQSSNYGSRVDCYGWGQNIDTTGDGWTGTSVTEYTTTFGGTSGASPIVTGAAIALQAIHRARHGRTLSPSRVRAVLADRSIGTRSGVPASDRIGVMPDLRRIVAHLSLAPAAAPARRRPAPATTAPARPSQPAPARPPVGDFPMPRTDVRAAALIDAGHGGVVDEEVPAAYGSPLARAHTARAVEKDINLQLARRVCDKLGTNGVLSRSGDYSLTLRERIERARAAQAAAFVSIHSNTGRVDRAGPEVWVYADDRNRGGPESLQLAQRIRTELAAVEQSSVPVRAGRFAVLRPELHGPGVAACLVETGSLAHPEGAARLSSQQFLDDVGAAVARGVSSYLAHDYAQRGGRYGSVVATEPDAAHVESPPEDAIAHICYHEGTEEEQVSWWDAEMPAAALVDTAPAPLRGLLSFLRVSYPTFAPQEAAYFRTLTEHLHRHGVVAAGTTLDRDSFTDAVRTFQSRRRIAVTGIPNEQTLWALQRDWALARRLATANVPADQVAGSRGYNRFRLRQDIVDRYTALRDAVRAAGGVITSAGSFRDLGANVTAGRSSTSMHYSGLALDLATDTGMRNTAQQYLITREGTRRWRVWCRSDSAPERTLDAVIWRNGAITTQSVTARCFDFTALAEANGFSSIGPRSSFPGDYGSAEWWHFQCELPLARYVSQFGIELLSLAAYTEASLSRHTGIWSNRLKVFRKGRSGWY
jgi:N-acetylmuramoyl-L-alanine amidase